MKTAMQKLFDRLENRHVPIDTKSHLWQMLKENSLAFERECMAEFADRYADDVMGGCLLRGKEYYDQYYGVSPQDPAICEYSGLRPVEGYKEDIELEEGVEMFKIDETDEERAYRRGYMDGYDEGLYDGEYK